MSTMSLNDIANLFRDDLNDLTTNDRWQIQTLTVIARDHIEAAHEISEVLEKHIRTTAPTRKLPALYVLDSVVKNVGSPYTIYLGRNLYAIFMDAYTLVDGLTRKAMESMLRTWKDPISTMDPTPVFPVETTSTIENALIRARTVALQRGPPMLQRSTPPPNNAFMNGYHRGPPPPQGQPPQMPNDPRLAQSILASLGQQPPQNDLFRLQEDIKALIANSQQQFAMNVYDVSVQKRLQALLDLQNIVKTQQLSPEAIGMITAQVSSLSAAAPPPVTQPQWQPSAAPSQAAPFAPGALSALMAAAAKPGTPNLPPAMPVMPFQQPPPSSVPPAGLVGASLIDALRSAGLAQSQTPVSQPAVPAALPAAVTIPLPTGSAADLLRSLTGIVPKSSSIPPVALPKSRPNPPTPAEVKVFRPELVASLYEAQPNQCSTCGRRFPGTEAGKAMKATHLDWHFRSNQRSADAIDKSHFRKFYLDEMEWASLPNYDPSSGNTTDVNGMSDEAQKGDDTADTKSEITAAAKWVKVPPTGSGIEPNCPICQENFTPSWHEGAQEWAWMDAIKVGNKVYHATCHEEVKKASSSLQDLGRRSMSPDVGGTGKRKANDTLESLRAKLTRAM